MFNFQDEKEYKSILKTMIFYMDKFLVGKKSSVTKKENLEIYTERLAEFVPALINLCDELNVFYGANLPSLPLQTGQNKVGLAEILIPVLKKEINHNPHFNQVPLSFEIISPNFSSDLRQTQNYVNSKNDDYFDVKSAYFLQRLLTAADASLINQYDNWQLELLKSIENARLDLILTSAVSLEKYGVNVSSQDINLGIFQTCLEFFDKTSQPISKNLYISLIKNYRSQHLPIAGDGIFLDALKNNLPQIKNIIKNNMNGFRQLKQTENLLHKTGGFIEDYAARSVANIIIWQKDEIKENKERQDLLSQLSFSQSDMDALLQEYDYSQLERRTAAEYKNYKKLSPVFEGYTERQIQSPEVKNYFAAKYKRWREHTSIHAAACLNDLMREHYNATIPVEDLLDCAKDVIMIGSLSKDYFKMPEQNGISVRITLDTSGYDFDYINRLSNNPEKVKAGDYLKLADILKDYGQNCRKFIDYLDLNAEEQDAEKNVSANEFLSKLNKEQPGAEKEKYVMYSLRMFENDYNYQEKNLQILARQLNFCNQAVHGKSHRDLQAYLQDGAEFYPELTPKNRMEMQDVIEGLGVSEVIVPLSLQEEFDEESFNDLLGSIDELNYRPVVASFIKSAAKGYQRSVLKAHQQHIKENGIDNFQKNMALFYNNSLDILSDMEQHLKALDAMAKEQMIWSANNRNYQVYQQNEHPDKNEITRMILKGGKRKR